MMKTIGSILISLLFCTGMYAQVLPLNKSLPVLLSTFDATSGAPTNADSTPSCTAYAPGSSTAVYTAAAVSMSTGKYRWAATLSTANGFAVGNAYRIQCDATVGGVAGSVDKGTVYVVVAELTAGTPRIDVSTIANQATAAAGGITFPGTIASPTNITSGTIGLTANAIDAGNITTAAVGKIQTGLYTIQKNVAGQKFPITFYDSMTSNPKPGVTGASCSESKDYGGFTPSSGSPTEVGNGFYGLSATQAETNANLILIYCTASGARAFQSIITTQH